jgi:hypothetical protein
MGMVGCCWGDNRLSHSSHFSPFIILRNAKLRRCQHLHSTMVELQLSLDGNFIRRDDVNTRASTRYMTGRKIRRNNVVRVVRLTSHWM